jgi:ubiquitin carboxyl-terminal hydrolase L5
MSESKGNSAGNWCLIESDPGVFTELIRGFGVQGVQVEELYSLDDDVFTNIRPVHGLIFLFKWRPGEDAEGQLRTDVKDVYFAQQVISNACASQAIINLLLNVDNPNVTLGQTLEGFKSFTQGFDPANRGLCLSNSEDIRNMHNSFSREHYMELEQPKGGKDDNYHFITYVPVKRGDATEIYELDGLQRAPVFVGTVKENQDWLEVVKPWIQMRIEKYQSGEIHFNLMAIISDLRAKYQKRIDELQNEGMDSDVVNEEINHLRALITEEEEKMNKYKLENNRRRHNYIPFIVELLKILAKEGKLVGMVKTAQQKKRKQQASEQKKA